MQTLTKNNTSKDVELKLTDVKEYWKEYLQLLNTKANLTTAASIMDKNPHLLDLCDQVVSAIESSFEEKSMVTEDKYRSVRLVNISRKQRMLSQRLCLYYTGAKLFSKDQNNYKLLLRKIFNEFDSVIIKLITNPSNTPKIQKNIGKVLVYWELLTTNEMSLYKSEFEIGDVFSITNKLTNTFDTIIHLYTELANKKR